MRFALPSAAVRSTWPACSIDCGIFVEDERVPALLCHLQEEEEAAHDIPSFFECDERRSSVAVSQDDDEQQVNWTDGASSLNQGDRFRRAGCGIYYGDGHCMNMSAILPGLVQTNQRAELLAVVLACLRDPRQLDIRSDSSYACAGFVAWKSWVDKGWKGYHADLWNMLGAELRSRVSAVAVSWVKGHAKQIDIDRGRTTAEDKRGNDGADKLAVAGANKHRVSSDVVESAKQRRDDAMIVQRMMVAVLQARALAEGSIHNEADDEHLSEMAGDDDCTKLFKSLDDEFDTGAAS